MRLVVMKIYGKFFIALLCHSPSHPFELSWYLCGADNEELVHLSVCNIESGYISDLYNLLWRHWRNFHDITTVILGDNWMHEDVVVVVNEDYNKETL